MLVDKNPREEKLGIHVLKRRGQTKTAVASELAQVIVNFATMPDGSLATGRKNAREIAELYNWRNLIKSYQRACKQAIENARQRTTKAL